MIMSDNLSTHNLVKHYINICNTAFTRHKDELIFGSALAVLNKYASGEVITLQVVDAADKPLGYYTTRFIDGEFTPVMEGDQGNSGACFDLRRSYLEHVFRNADDYIDNPEKFDWRWLSGS